MLLMFESEVWQLKRPFSRKGQRKVMATLGSPRVAKTTRERIGTWAWKFDPTWLIRQEQKYQKDTDYQKEGTWSLLAVQIIFTIDVLLFCFYKSVKNSLRNLIHNLVLHVILAIAGSKTTISREKVSHFI